MIGSGRQGAATHARTQPRASFARQLEIAAVQATGMEVTGAAAWKRTQLRPDSPNLAAPRPHYSRDCTGGRARLSSASAQVQSAGN